MSERVLRCFYPLVESGAQLDFLIGAANETKQQMSDCAKALDEFKNTHPEFNQESFEKEQNEYYVSKGW